MCRCFFSIVPQVVWLRLMSPAKTHLTLFLCLLNQCPLLISDVRSSIDVAHPLVLFCCMLLYLDIVDLFISLIITLLLVPVYTILILSMCPSGRYIPAGSFTWSIMTSSPVSRGPHSEWMCSTVHQIIFMTCFMTCNAHHIMRLLYYIYSKFIICKVHRLSSLTVLQFSPYCLSLRSGFLASCAVRWGEILMLFNSLSMRFSVGSFHSFNVISSNGFCVPTFLDVF